MLTLIHSKTQKNTTENQQQEFSKLIKHYQTDTYETKLYYGADENENSVQCCTIRKF